MLEFEEEAKMLEFLGVRGAAAQRSVQTPSAQTYEPQEKTQVSKRKKPSVLGAAGNALHQAGLILGLVFCVFLMIGFLFLLLSGPGNYAGLPVIALCFTTGFALASWILFRRLRRLRRGR